MPPLKYFVPNSFTALSLVLGLASCVQSARGGFELAAWMILWCVLLDKADGTAARLCHATSAIGLQLDSFADFISFGVAPAALVYFRLAAAGGHEGAPRLLLGAAAALYVLALALRLARFNLTEPGDSRFIGVPGTLAGAVVAASYLSSSKYHLPEALLDYGPVLLLVLALLMVSAFELPKLKVRRSAVFNVLQFGNVAAAYVLAPLRIVPDYLLVLATAYMIGGLGWCALHPEGEGEPEADVVDGDEPERARQQPA